MVYYSTPENLRIVAALKLAFGEIPIGGTRPYAQFNAIAGLDVQKRRRDLLDKAKGQAEKEYGCIFECVREVGMKRLIADETAHVGSQAISSTRRKVKRAIRRTTQVSSNSMSGDARQNVALKLVHLHLLHGLADNRRTSSMFTTVNSDPLAAQRVWRTSEGE
jgi:hypothetical protein